MSPLTEKLLKFYLSIRISGIVIGVLWILIVFMAAVLSVNSDTPK